MMKGSVKLSKKKKETIPNRRTGEHDDVALSADL